MPDPRRAALALALLVAPVSGAPLGAVRAPVAFVDPFETLDLAAWEVFAGRGPGSCVGEPCWDPGHATVADGRLELRVDGARRSGAQLRTYDAFHGGVLEVRARSSPVPGAVLAFFTYECPPGEEIDFFEILTGTRTMWVTTWHGQDCETLRSHDAFTLPFDPAAGDHAYQFVWLPDRLVVLADGALLGAVPLRDPYHAQRLYLSLWAPAWLDRPAGEDVVASVEDVVVAHAPPAAGALGH